MLSNLVDQIIGAFYILYPKFLVQTSPGTRPGFGTQPYFKAPSDFQVKMVKI